MLWGDTRSRPTGPLSRPPSLDLAKKGDAEEGSRDCGEEAAAGWTGTREDGYRGRGRHGRDLKQRGEQVAAPVDAYDHHDIGGGAPDSLRWRVDGPLHPRESRVQQPGSRSGRLRPQASIDSRPAHRRRRLMTATILSTWTKGLTLLPLGRMTKTAA